MYTKEQAKNKILREVCKGIQECDIQQLREKAINSREEILFKALRQDFYEVEHGWIYHCQTGGFKKNGKPIQFIGSGSAIAFNHDSGNYQEFGYGGPFLFQLENFKRTGDINRGCKDTTILLRISEWDKDCPVNQSFVADIKTTLGNIIKRHVELTIESIRQQIDCIFPTPEGGAIFLEARSATDAGVCSEEINVHTSNLEKKHDCWVTEIAAHAYSSYR